MSDPEFRDRAAAWELAFELAERAAAEDEPPVGALVVGPDGRVLGQGRDRKAALRDPTAHAEVLAIREAAAALGDWRLDGCALLVTLEPCAMCAGTILLARVAEVSYAAPSPKFGALESQCDLFAAGRWNHRPSVTRAPEPWPERSAALLRTYFRSLRERKKALKKDAGPAPEEK